MSSIFELTDDYRQIAEMMDDPELDPQTLKDTMEGIQGELEDKFDSYAWVAIEIQSDIKALDETIKTLQARKKSKENNLKKMKQIMTEVALATDHAKFKTPYRSYWIQKNPESVIIDAENVRDIPEDYLNFKEPEPNMTAIKQAIHDGVKFDGIAHLEQTEGIRWR